MVWAFGVVCFFIGWLVGQSGKESKSYRDPAANLGRCARLVEDLPEEDRMALLMTYVPRLDFRRVWEPDMVVMFRAVLREAVEQKVDEEKTIEAAMRAMADRIEGAAHIMEEIETRLRKKYVMVERVATVDGVTIGITEPNPPIGD